MAQQLQRIVESEFLKGYNDTDKPEHLKKGYMADIVNAFIEENKIIKRSGYSTIGDAPVLKSVLGQFRHEPSGGTKYILRVRNNSGDTNAVIEGWSGSGNWTALTSGSSQTASLTHRPAMASNATYIFNGTDTVVKTTNGTSVSTVAAIPVGTMGKWFHNYFFVIGVTGNKSRLYFSDVNAPETFDASNGYIDVNPGDNEELLSMAVLKDELLLFKASRIWSLTGYGTDDFILSDLGERNTNIGTIAPDSIVETGNDVYFLSFQGGVPHFRSMKRTDQGYVIDGGIISDAIVGTMNRLVKTRLSQCQGVFDGRRIWWTVCTSGSTNNEVLVLDTLNEGFVRHTGINASFIHVSTISGVPALYFGSSTANGLSYHLDGSSDDNDSAIDFQVKTPMYAPIPGHKCRFKYFYLTGDVENDVDLDLDYSRDGFTFGDLSTISLTGSGAVFGTAIFGSSKFGSTNVSRQRVDFAGGNAYYMQYRLRNNAANEDVSIREWEIFFQPKGLRDII